MTVQEQIDATTNLDGPVLVDGESGEHVVMKGDRRISGASRSTPWWGRDRIVGVTVGVGRVIVEDLKMDDLEWVSGYLGRVSDVLVTRSLKLGAKAITDPKDYPSALTVVDVSVQRAAEVCINMANLRWFGGSIEYTQTDFEISSGLDFGTVAFTGTRFEHDAGREIHLRGPSPVIMTGCHFTSTTLVIHGPVTLVGCSFYGGDVVIAPDAPADVNLIGCVHTSGSRVDDRRRKKPWWRVF
jgi:hypothetical protein